MRRSCSSTPTRRSAPAPASPRWRPTSRLRHPDLALDAHRVHADPVSALIEASGDADLLVLGCRHSTEHFDARLGPVPASILPRVHCPVMLVGAYPHHLRRRSPATPVRSEPTAH